jgi:hypothetical protein
VGLLDSIHVFEDGITGGAFETLAAADGDSLSIRDYGEGSLVTLLECWGANNVTKCDFSIRSPLLHDNTRGLRFAHMFNPTQSGADGNPNIYLPPSFTQKYWRTDTLIVEVNGAAADDVAFTQLLYYEGGATPQAQLITYEQLEAQRVNTVGIRVSPAPPAATSTYGTAEAINADDDRLKANKRYAWLGLTTDLPFTTLSLNGPDTANFRIAMPGYRDEAITAGWFMDMAKRLSLPLIPVIHANNRANTLVRLADVGGGTAPLVSLLFAELS